MKQMKHNTYYVEVFDKVSKRTVHSMLVDEGEFNENEFQEQLDIMDSNPDRYKRITIPVYEYIDPDGVVHTSAPKE